MPYFDILFLIVGVAFFARGAEMDGKSPLVWGALSAAASAVTWLWFAGGFAAWLVGQAAVYALLFGWSVWSERKAGGGRIRR